jgi:hypothetical protein
MVMRWSEVAGRLVLSPLSLSMVMRWSCRWSEVAGRMVLSPLQLAILERKREVVGSLLKDLTTDQLLHAVTNRILILEDKVNLFMIFY